MISLDWTLLYQTALFLVLMVFMGKVLFKPMLAVMDAREKAHAEPARRARELTEKANTAQARYEEIMSSAWDKSQKIRNELASGASDKERLIVSEAHKQSEQTISAARAQIEKARDGFLKDAAKFAEDLSDQLTATLLEGGSVAPKKKAAKASGEGAAKKSSAKSKAKKSGGKAKAKKDDTDNGGSDN
ncbi:ATP synthase F0 subunit B [bacterium]|nr:ATP synthase F0 subunit B [bacterium]